jgi:type VI protein secretion system component Hcp
MRKVCLLATLMLVSAAAVAQGASETHIKPPAPKASIIVTVNGLSCQTTAGTNMFSVQAWSWGASNPVDIGSGSTGAGAGKASISDLNVQKNFDQCSPALFGAVVTGKHFNTLTLTQLDGNGNVVLTLTLSEVLVSSWQMSGSVNQDLPIESVSFAFAKVCIAETAGGGKFCYDLSKAATF